MAWTQFEVYLESEVEKLMDIGRKLNVLCTFNLSPVFRGIQINLLIISH